MAKLRVVVGYGEQVDKGAGVWVDEITERPYKGELERTASSLREGENLNKELSLSNSISIVADAYANEHFFAIRYVTYAGADWEVNNVDASVRPRLLLQLGGVYSGEKPTP